MIRICLSLLLVAVLSLPAMAKDIGPGRIPPMPSPVPVRQAQHGNQSRGQRQKPTA